MQFNFFDPGKNDANNAAALGQLPGLKYQESLITPTAEKTLVEQLTTLPFEEFDFRGFKGKRKVVSFGWRYDYSGSQLRKADTIPDFLRPLRAAAASFAQMEPASLEQVLVTEYGPGAGIGWHRDKAVFGEVVGISLLSPCILRFRRLIGEKQSMGSRQLKTWDRVNLFATPRSAYLLSVHRAQSGTTVF
jgi:alkylated DNA repair dioxygenase AlkB